MDLAQKAVFLKNIAEIAEHDVKDVQKLKAKHLGPEFNVAPQVGPNGEDGMGIIVCDDYHHHHDNNNPAGSKSGPNWALLLGILGSVGMLLLSITVLAGIYIYSRNMAGALVPNGNGAAQGDKQVAPVNTTIEKKSGFIIDLPGAKK